jgi:hypothetical protein
MALLRLADYVPTEWILRASGRIFSAGQPGLYPKRLWSSLRYGLTIWGEAFREHLKGFEVVAEASKL